MKLLKQLFDLIPVLVPPLAERGIAKRPWGESFRSGKGAAVGRALSTIIKGGFAVVAALVLIVGAFVN